ncbi:hypothetical protein [Nocardioides sp. InS609-2]|uniref:hypothetical protein n=1 Tax=Nocardioides sp. InS609-2 TaxID=2760705 RepID=UPI0020BD72B0|nr:hypothetical protein [Nocardioides sp. InS609-2]
MSTSPASLPPAWSGLLDDAAIFPPGNARLADAVESYAARSSEWYADLVGSFVCKDTDIGSLDAGMPLSIVVTGGAGAIAGALKLAGRRDHHVAGLEIALRDLDDLAGNARRVVAAVDAARSDGLLDDDTEVFVELPQTVPGAGWLGAADEVAAAELRLKFRTGGVDANLFPAAGQIASWIDAALDRETPFKCTAGLHNAVRHRDDATGFEHHGFLNVLLATGALFDGATADDAVALLESREGPALADRSSETDLAGARRWFTSFGSCSVREPLDDLLTLGLLKERP